MDGFEGSLKSSRNKSAETNRNHSETSMKPRETKVAGHKRNRETAPLQGRSLVSPRGFAAGRWPRACTVSPTSDGPTPWNVSISLYCIQIA
jgi:hypothetical protein